MSDNRLSPVAFPGDARVHVGFPVRDLEGAVAFYRVLLGVEPTKVRPGYAKFEPASPSVNLTLNESGAAEAGRGFHFGIQLKSTGALGKARKRMKDAGLIPAREEGVTCCYAVQDKFWVNDPVGNEWEFFVVLETDAPARQDKVDERDCCAEDCCEKEEAVSSAP